MTPGDPGFSDVPGVFKRLFHTEKSILSGGSAESSGYFMLHQESQHVFFHLHVQHHMKLVF